MDAYCNQKLFQMSVNYRIGSNFSIIYVVNVKNLPCIRVITLRSDVLPEGDLCYVVTPAATVVIGSDALCSIRIASPTVMEVS